MKIGIIRCQQTEDVCAGTTCFKFFNNKLLSENEADFEIIGFVSCGGCPGKRAVSRAKRMVAAGAQTIALASCIGKGTPMNFVCPHFEQMKSSIIATVRQEIQILDYTH
jgi:predicted metal-binding protein